MVINTIYLAQVANNFWMCIQTGIHDAYQIECSQVMVPQLSHCLFFNLVYDRITFDRFITTG